MLAGDTLKITKKEDMKGEDGHKVFSVRLKEQTVSALDIMAQKTNRSRNELINLLLEFAIANAEIEE